VWPAADILLRWKGKLDNVATTWTGSGRGLDHDAVEMVQVLCSQSVQQPSSALWETAVGPILKHPD
jgi:hypothetical protein